MQGGRPRTTVAHIEGETPPKRGNKDIQKAMKSARGAWGRGKSLAEIDREIAARRVEDWRDEGPVTQ